MNKLIFSSILILVIGCSEKEYQYFPLSDGKIWNYSIVINPGVEDKLVYKKTNFTLEKQTILGREKKNKKQVYPIIREDNSIYYYAKNKNGITREGMQQRGDFPIKYEKDKKYVLKFPLKLGTEWQSVSKTYLILRRYAYFDYRATTNFDLKYKIDSLDESIKVPAGKFDNCIKIIGNGKTTFIGDREIGTIKILVSTIDWYAPNVGLVKSIRKEETDSDLFGTSKMVQVLDDYK